MKLFQINSTLNWGSTGRVAEEIGQTVMEQGWESYIAYGRYRNSNISNVIWMLTEVIHYLEKKYVSKKMYYSKCSGFA